MKVLKVAVAAGGTGGHVYPALAVVSALKQLRATVDVYWIGTARGIESSVVPKAGIPFQVVPVQAWRGRKGLSKIRAAFGVLIAVKAAYQWMRRVRPDVLLGMGGYVSGPAGCVACLLGIPVVIHEQNARMGLTNRLLAHFAQRILFGLPNPAQERYAARASRLGNPVRQTFQSVAPPAQRFVKKSDCVRRVLVLGGSLGAKAINLALPVLLGRLQSAGVGLGCLDVLHQCGDCHLAATLAEYRHQGVQLKGEAVNGEEVSAAITVTVVPFIEEVANSYAWADFVICRAGALTIAELAVVGVGAVLVPYPYAVDDHQVCNAQTLVAVEAGQIVEQGEGFVERLFDVVKRWLQMDVSELLVRAQNARLMASPDAAVNIAEYLLAGDGVA